MRYGPLIELQPPLAEICPSRKAILIRLAATRTRPSMPVERKVRPSRPVPPVPSGGVLEREYGVTFADASGDLLRQLVSGTLIIGLTNVDNGRSITIDISGPAEFVVHADGSSTFTLRGNSMPIAPDGLFRTTGTVVQEYDSEGNLLSTTQTAGTRTDVCAAIS
jgi:hypothetical protein